MLQKTGLISCGQAIFYPCPTWPLPCRGAVTCRSDGILIWAFGITYSLLEGRAVVSLTFGLCTTGHALGVEEEAVNWATGVQSEGSDNYTDHNEDLV